MPMTTRRGTKKKKTKEKLALEAPLAVRKTGSSRERWLEHLTGRFNYKVTKGASLSVLLALTVRRTYKHPDATSGLTERGCQEGGEGALAASRPVGDRRSRQTIGSPSYCPRRCNVGMIRPLTSPDARQVRLPPIDARRKGSRAIRRSWLFAAATSSHVTSRRVARTKKNRAWTCSYGKHACPRLYSIGRRSSDVPAGPLLY